MVDRLSAKTGCIYLDLSDNKLCCRILHSFITLGLWSDAVHVCWPATGSFAAINVSFRDCCDCFCRNHLFRLHAFTTCVRRHGGFTRDFLLFSYLWMDHRSNNNVLGPTLHKTYSPYESSLRQSCTLRSSYVHHFKCCRRWLQLLARQGWNHHSRFLPAIARFSIQTRTSSNSLFHTNWVHTQYRIRLHNTQFRQDH